MNITESYLLIGNVILLIGIAVTVRVYYLIALKYNKPKLRLKVKIVFLLYFCFYNGFYVLGCEKFSGDSDGLRRAHG